jgi:hypothetical protein
MMTAKKISTGEFEVLWNGASTEFYIFNGSLGMSGRNTANVYGIKNTETGKLIWSTTLQMAKKTVARWLEKRSA